MELRPLCVMFLLTELILCTQTGDLEKPKPVVIIKPDAQVFRGEKVTFKCEIQSAKDIEWSYSWYKYDDTENSYKETQEFSISSVTDSDRGTYTCRGKRSDSQFSVDSDPVTLTVSEKPKPTVIVTPQSSVYTGDTVTLSCNLMSTGWTFFWYEEPAWTPLPPEGSDTNTLTVRGSYEGQVNYYCEARRGNYDSERSEPATITVTEKPKPQLTSNIKGDVLRGNSVNLSCTLTPKSAGWKFYWSEYTQSRWTETETETTSDSYTISSVYYRIQYRCRAGRENRVFYTDYSNVLSLNVIESPKPTVTINPDTQVFIGETVNFWCDVQKGSDTEWTYGWFRDSNTLYPYSTRKEFSISYDKVSHSRQYTCRGKRTSDSQMSQMSDPVTLSVSKKPKPELTSSLKGAALTGNSVNLYCTLTTQSTGWKFYWSKPTQSSETEAETTSDFYTISSDKVYDGIQYKCRAGRGNPVYYTDYSNVLSLTVNESPKPTVTINPDTQVFIYETVTFRCDVEEGGDTEWTYDWFRDSNTLYSYSTRKEFSIRYVTVSDRGQYTCRGRRTSDYQMSQMSDSVTLSVSGKPKPTVTVTPQSSVYTGDNVTLSCNLMSTGWTFLFYEGPPWNSLTPEGSDTNTHTLRVSNKGRVNYYCIARRGNYDSERSEPATITVRTRPKPEVKVQPADHGFVFTGETVTFSCEIKTGGSWEYHWFRDNNELGDAAGKQIYKIIGVKESHKGVYRCKGTSDPQYTETSDAVTLTVSEKPKPELTSDLKGAALTGNPLILYCTLTPQSAGWKFYWIKPTQSSETETETNQFFISSVRVSDGGQYKCRAGRGNPVYYTDYSDELWVNVTRESSPVSLVIRPSRTQHFTADSLSLSCEDQSNSTGWTVRRYTHNETSFNCSSVSGSTCNISSLSTSHTGVYWCQSESGERSNSVNITVHNGPVILDSPVHPVSEGQPLILRCLNRQKLSVSGVYFYQNDSILQKQTTGEMIISIVSKSDEGFYHCKHPERGESLKSWVSVRDGKAPTSVLKLLSSVATASLYVLVTIILAVKCYRARAEPDEDNRPYRVMVKGERSF